MNIAAFQEKVQRAFDFLRRRSVDYRLAFGQPAGQQVLIDLAKFCRANHTCFHEDPRMHAVLEGRREVWLRIQNHLNLTPEQLLALYGGNEYRVVSGDEE